MIANMWSWARRSLAITRRTLQQNSFLLGQWLPRPVTRVFGNRRVRFNLLLVTMLPLTSYALGTQTDLTPKPAQSMQAEEPIQQRLPLDGIAHAGTLPPGKSLPGTPPPSAAPAAPPVARLASNVTYANNYARGQCTWWVAHMRPVPPRWGNAENWFWRAKQAGWAVGSVPRPGAIAWTAAGWAGHVAYVESVNGNMITISEMNYFGPGAFNRRRAFGGSVDNRTVAASWFHGYIY